MGGDGLLDHQPVVRANAECAAQRVEMTGSALALGSFDQRGRMTRQADHGLGLAQRQADAAESTAAAAVQVEKAEMQAGRHFYGDGIRHMPPNGCIMDASSEV